MKFPTPPSRFLRRRVPVRTIAVRLLFIGAFLATLLALFWVEENWRAARAWAACQRELTARGERLDSGAFDPAFIPAARNLARTPLLAGLWNYTADPRTGVAIFPCAREKISRSPLLSTMPQFDTQLNQPPPTVSNIFGGQPTDLRAWQEFYRREGPQGSLPPTDEKSLPPPAGDILRALEYFRPLLDELEHAAATMPDGILRDSSHPGDNGIGELAIGSQHLVKTLTLRASARLAAGQITEAWHDIELILWLRDATPSAPATLLPEMIGCNDLLATLQPVWEGLAKRRWHAEELAAIQRRLQGAHLLMGWQRAMRGERAYFVKLVDDLMRGRYTGRDFVGYQGDLRWDASLWLFLHGPSGWIVQNKVNVCWFYQDHFLDEIDVPARRIGPERIAATEAAMIKIAQPPVWPTQVLVFLGLGGFTRSLERIADVQVVVDEATVACALERYALEHDGHYPASLEALTPRYLDGVPVGVVDGAPMRYQPAPDGRYQLAARLTDHPMDYRRNAAAVKAGDFIWRYPVEQGAD